MHADVGNPNLRSRLKTYKHKKEVAIYKNEPKEKLTDEAQRPDCWSK